MADIEILASYEQTLKLFVLFLLICSNIKLDDKIMQRECLDMDEKN
jgi:hypothetical protein